MFYKKSNPINLNRMLKDAYYETLKSHRIVTYNVERDVKQISNNKFDYIIFIVW